MDTNDKGKLYEWALRRTTLRALGMTALVVLASMAAGPAWGAAISVTLDDFASPTVPSPLTQTTVGDAVSAQAGLSGVLGGDRTTTLSVISGPGVLATQAAIGAGDLSFGSPPGTVGRVRLDYTNVGTLDLSLAGSSLDFSIFSNDLGGLFGLRLWDADANEASSLFNVAGGTVGDQSIDIAGNPDFAGLDLENITAVRFAFRGNPDTDLVLTGGLTLNNVNQQEPTVVPEPASLAMWSLMALGGVAFTRRRRKTITRR